MKTEHKILSIFVVLMGLLSFQVSSVNSVPSPTPSPIPNPSASPTPKATPSPTAAASPSASPTPSVGGQPNKTSSLSYSISCPGGEFRAVLELKENDKAARDVRMKFIYAGQEKVVTTNGEGKAEVAFSTATTNTELKAEPENFAGQSTTITRPTCDQPGQVQGVTTPQSFAPTGSSAQVAELFIFAGSWLTSLGFVLKRVK